MASLAGCFGRCGHVHEHVVDTLDCHDRLLWPWQQTSHNANAWEGQRVASYRFHRSQGAVAVGPTHSQSNGRTSPPPASVGARRLLALAAAIVAIALLAASSRWGNK